MKHPMLSSKNPTRKFKLHALGSGTELVSKRVKAIKLADKSEFGLATVNEYLSDELAFDSTTKREFTGPSGEPRGKLIKRSVVVSVPTTAEPVPPLHSVRLLRQDPGLLI